MELSIQLTTMNEIRNNIAVMTLMKSNIEDKLFQSDVWKSIKTFEQGIFEANKQLEIQQNEIRDLMLQNKVKKFEMFDKTLTLKKSPGAINIKDEKMIPEKYLIEKTSISIDKKGIKEGIENGDVIPGAEIVHTYSLIVTENK